MCALRVVVGHDEHRQRREERRPADVDHVVIAGIHTRSSESRQMNRTPSKNAALVAPALRRPAVGTNSQTSTNETRYVAAST